jgi:hypothetical protein
MPATPFLDDCPFETMIQHQSKRRRVLPPVLDGQARGWGKSGDEDGDDEYDEYPEDPVDPTDVDGRVADAAGYKSANGVLHELHALHRRRHFLSPSSNPQPSWPQTNHPLSQVHDKNRLRAEPPETVTPTDELLRVMERYEDTNRCDLFVLITASSHYR